MGDALIVGVRFKPAGRVVYFSADDPTIDFGAVVLAPGEGGPRPARVVIAPRQLLQSELAEPLPALIRSRPDPQPPRT